MVARGRLRQWQAPRADMESAPTSPLKLKLHLFRQVCRGRIYASRAAYPLYRIIGTAAAGGIYAAPTSQPILFILVYGRGRGMPRPYKATRKRVVIQSSAVHGRFVGEGLDPPGVLMVPQTSAERSRPLPTMLSVGAGHARPGAFPVNERPRIAAGGACPAPTSPLKRKVKL